MILYLETPKDPTKGKKKRIRANQRIQPSSRILNQYTEIHGISCTTVLKYQKKKLRKQSNLQLYQKKIKNPGLNLTKEVKGLYTEKSKTDEKIKEDSSK